MKIAIASLFLLVGIFTANINSYLQNRQALGSVNIGGEYKATTTDAAFGNGIKVYKTGPGTLGSVVVTLTSNAPIAFYDATTTGAHSNHATTTLAIFKTTTAGTYTFDVSFTRGLVVDTTSTVGVASSSITSR